MLDHKRIYHTGFACHDIAKTQAELTDALGIEWAPIHYYSPLRLWRPGIGWTEEMMCASYSRPGPHQLELIQGAKGGFFDPDLMPSKRHIGLWTDELGAEVRRLLGLGWELLCAKGAPDDDYGTMAYMKSPTEGPTLELVSTELRPMLLAWFDEPFA